jgi:hypothetical protein
MKLSLICLAFAFVLATSGVSEAQAPPSGPTASAPAFIRLDGELKTATGEARTGAVTLVVSLYAGPGDTAALWAEAQPVTLDAAGRYTVFAGATQADGLPREFFASNVAQWIGVAVQGEPEQPRVRMLSVPYAVSAGNADTLGGVPVTDFVMTENLKESVKKALDGDTEAAGGGGGAGDPTTMGTSGRIAKFDGTGLPANVIDSVIAESGGNIGIGTTTPANVLVVSNGGAAGMEFQPSTGSFLAFNRATSAYTPFSINGSTITFAISGLPKFTMDASGSVGLNTTTPQNNFVVSNAGAAGLEFGASTGTVLSYNRTTSAYAPLLFNASAVSVATVGSTRITVDGTGNVGIGTTSPNNALVVSNGGAAGMEFAPSTGSFLAYNRATSAYAPFSFNGSTITFSVSGAPAATINASGNIGIGTTTPTAKLQVVGDVVVSGNIGAKYQDVAEWVETGEPLEVGTVVIVAVGEVDQVVPSVRAYDTRVAGAVSRQPGLILGERGDSKSLIAQSGRVRIKVDATFGAIKPGDLLVTSPTPGHAMRSKPMKIGGQLLHRPGTLVGKALEGLPGGKGEILVLLTLQ